MSTKESAVRGIVPKNVNQVGVIGAGQMGAGIAQVLASSGIHTLLYDASEEALEKGHAGIKRLLERLVEKEKLSDSDKDSILGRISLSRDLKDFADTDVVIEAIVENTEAKLSLLEQLDSICKDQTVFASNTSSISITKLAAGCSRPDRVVGMHFMNPVPVMKLVEVIRGLQTSDETYNAIISLTEALGKTHVTARLDYPGFIVNRILVPMLNEAFFALMDGIATPEEIDTAMKLGTNQPMGPLELADFVGLDTCLSILQIFHEEFGDDKYRPCPLLVKYVEAGWVGRKSGKGFYDYK